MGKRIIDLNTHTNLIDDDRLVIVSGDTTLSTTLSELNEYINEVNNFAINTFATDDDVDNLFT